MEIGTQYGNVKTMTNLRGYFQEGERKAIYNSAENLRDRALIRLLWVTGRRIREILNIKVSDIDWEMKQIIVHLEKKKRDVVDVSYIDDFTVNLLRNYIKYYRLKNDDFLFKSDYTENKSLTRQRAFQIVRRLAKKAGIESVGGDKPHPHHFRHSLAVDIARKMKNPADLRKLQMLLGHSSLSITERYLKFSNEEIRELIENIGD